MLYLLLAILTAIFLLWFVAVVLVWTGVRFGDKFRIVEFKSFNKTMWKIEHKIWFGWYHFNCDGEYWNGEYDDKEKCISDFNKVKENNRKTIILK